GKRNGRRCLIVPALGDEASCWKFDGFGCPLASKHVTFFGFPLWFVIRKPGRGFTTSASPEVLRLRAMEYRLSDKSARRYAQDDSFGGGEEVTGPQHNKPRRGFSSAFTGEAS